MRMREKGVSKFAGDSLLSDRKWNRSLSLSLCLPFDNNNITGEFPERRSSVFLLRAIRILARESAGFPHSPSFPDSRLAIFQFPRKKEKQSSRMEFPSAMKIQLNRYPYRILLRFREVESRTESEKGRLSKESCRVNRALHKQARDFYHRDCCVALSLSLRVRISQTLFGSFEEATRDV